MSEELSALVREIQVFAWRHPELVGELMGVKAAVDDLRGGGVIGEDAELDLDFGVEEKTSGKAKRSFLKGRRSRAASKA
jgi:hypothetical protein